MIMRVIANPNGPPIMEYEGEPEELAKMVKAINNQLNIHPEDKDD